jgi:hypothetical protein
MRTLLLFKNCKLDSPQNNLITSKLECINSPNRAGIRNTSDYSTFGVELDGRTVSLEGYK